MNVGKTIAKLRAEKGFSQQTLAELLFVSRDLVSKWENGSRRPDYTMIGRIAQVFGVSVDIIFNREDQFLDELSDCFPENVSITEDDLANVLNAFLHSIGRRGSDVFVKRYYFQKSAAEISADCGIRENHVRSILSKTRKKLKKYMEEYSWTE